MASNKSAGIEASAVSVLKRAVEYDTQNRATSSLVCYQEGIQLLMDLMKTTTDDKKKLALRERVESYMDRAEKLKQYINTQKEAGKFNEKIQIADGSKGYSYEVTMGQLMDSAVRCVEVEDPYIMAVHQCQNFLRFCELLVRKCPNLRRIILNTKENERGSAAEQRERIEQIKSSLADHSISLIVNYSSTLHDREIRFDTGWVVSLGRGLDYFKATPTKFSIGFFDQNLRECHETTINIGHRDNIRLNS